MEHPSTMPILRDSTAWFIAQDPTTIELVRRGAQRTDTGATGPVGGATLPPQEVKLIGSSSDSISRGEGGNDRSSEYVVLLCHDGDIAIGDHWKAGDAFWYVYAIEADNGYEVKARARQYAKLPSDG